MSAIQITLIDSLENQARIQARKAQEQTNIAIEAIEQAQRHYYAMYDACLELRQRQAHISNNMSWQDYFEELTGFNISRWYQIDKVIQHARLIEAETGYLPSEVELRHFPTYDVPISEKAAILALYDTAKQVASVATNGKRKNPEKSDYTMAIEVIQDIRATFINGDDSDKDEILETLITRYFVEKDKRRLQHIHDNSSWELVKREKAIGIGLRKNTMAHRIRSRSRVNWLNSGQIMITNKRKKRE